MRLVLDCDPGNGFPGADIDDGLALGLILASAEFELTALTIVGGNTAVAKGTQSALNMLEVAGADMPVFAGSARPILEDHKVWRKRLDGFGKVPTTAALWRKIEPPRPKKKAAREKAANALVRLVDAHAGDITIVAVGPLTNVAQAILLDPELPQKVSRMVIMGGAFAMWHVLQEMNFGYDPEAAHIVVTSGAKITLVPLDVTMKTYLTIRQNDGLRKARLPLSRYLAETCDPWIRYVGQAKNRDGCPLHDPLAVATLIDPSVVTIEPMRVDVEIAGTLTRGRSVSWHPRRTTLTGTQRLHDLDPIDVAVDVDGDRFVKLLLGRLMG
jgi:inosine-uridine nucleoside N-ribohydrolase